MELTDTKLELLLNAYMLDREGKGQVSKGGRSRTLMNWTSMVGLSAASKPMVR